MRAPQVNMTQILHPGARHYSFELSDPDSRDYIMTMPVLTVSSKNYSSWALRGWLMCKMSGLKFDECKASVDDASMRAELLLLSPSCLVPSLEHAGIKVWDT